MADDSEVGMQSSENFWWVYDGILQSLKTHSAAILSLMWISLALASITSLFFGAKVSLTIIWLFLVGITIVWWFEIKRTEEWLSEHYGDWEEEPEAILGSQRVSKGGRRNELEE